MAGILNLCDSQIYYSCIAAFSKLGEVTIIGLRPHSYTYTPGPLSALTTLTSDHSQIHLSNFKMDHKNIERMKKNLQMQYSYCPYTAGAEHTMEGNGSRNTQTWLWNEILELGGLQRHREMLRHRKTSGQTFALHTFPYKQNRSLYIPGMHKLVRITYKYFFTNQPKMWTFPSYSPKALPQTSPAKLMLSHRKHCSNTDQGYSDSLLSQNLLDNNKNVSVLQPREYWRDGCGCTAKGRSKKERSGWGDLR